MHWACPLYHGYPTITKVNTSIFFETIIEKDVTIPPPPDVPWVKIQGDDHKHEGVVAMFKDGSKIEKNRRLRGVGHWMRHCTV
jgi:hypothetical protein